MAIDVGVDRAALLQGGHARDRARLVAAIGTACVGEAITRWLEHEDGGTLAQALDGVEVELRSLTP